MRRPLPPSTSVCEVRRTRRLNGRALGLTLYGLGRRIRFADIRQVPAFQGDIAGFEVMARPKTALGVVFLRQIGKPDRKVHWSRWAM